MYRNFTIDISSEEKKKKILELFKQFKQKTDIYKFFNITDNTNNIHYINDIAKAVGFDFSYYKEKKKRYCLQCGKELKYGQKKFCCSSCAAKYNNKGRKHSKETREKIAKSLSKSGHIAEKEAYCIFCGKLLHNGQHKFCSIQCYQKYMYNKRVEEWRINSDKYTTEQMPAFIKKYLMEKYDCKCQKCGWGEINPTTGNIPLEVHHIDGDCTNNKEENLELLCPNCHSLTPNNGSLNKISKRYKLKKYKDLLK